MHLLGAVEHEPGGAQPYGGVRLRRHLVPSLFGWVRRSGFSVLGSVMYVRKILVNRTAFTTAIPANPMRNQSSPYTATLG